MCSTITTPSNGGHRGDNLVPGITWQEIVSRPAAIVTSVPINQQLGKSLTPGRDRADWRPHLREIFALPFDVKFDRDGHLWVVDEYRNQTREYAPPFTPDMSATFILGSGNASSAATDEFGPSALGFDSDGMS